MIASISTLTKLVLPPERPVASEGDWNFIEDQLGCGLPDDYKCFISLYGSGSIADLMVVFSPFTKNVHVNLVRQLEKRAKGLRKFEEVSGEVRGITYHPAPKGLLPFGSADDGMLFCWVVAGSPAEWKVAIQGRYFDIEHFDGDLGTFLVALFSRQWTSPLLGVEIPRPPVMFEPEPESTGLR